MIVDQGWRLDPSSGEALYADDAEGNPMVVMPRLRKRTYRSSVVLIAQGMPSLFRSAHHDTCPNCQLMAIDASESMGWQRNRVLQVNESLIATIEGLIEHVDLIANERLETFARLTSEWKRDMAYSSSARAVSGHPAYQEIIGMGEDVVPMILEDLRRTHDHWFIALTTITGENPVKNHDRGDIPAMVNAWLDWAESRGGI